jgi:hypothetical protein
MSLAKKIKVAIPHLKNIPLCQAQWSSFLRSLPNSLGQRLLF